MRRYTMLACALVAVGSVVAAERDAWYRGSVVNLHFDNHSDLLAQEVPREDLAAALASIPVGMVQVSGQSNRWATYPTAIGLDNPAANGYDTLAVFREITRAQGKKLCVYMSVDRRPDQLAAHPEWAAREADDKVSVNGEPIVCQRPNRERKGYLYEQFLPQIKEIIAKYDPDGLWFDGDYILPRPCWCANCQKEWLAEMGRPAPREAAAVDWARWIGWHRERYREYRRVVAETIHQASPRCLYTTNWSWAWDPEPAPDFADTLSGDVGGFGQALRAAQRWGAQGKPFDIMSHATPGARSLARTYSVQRTLQEGAVTMAHGGIWFLWPFGGGALPPYGVDTARHLAYYARDRQPALGQTTSLAQVAVLDSETSWRAAGGTRSDGLAQDVARSLSEAHYLAEVVNEVTLRAAIGRYAVVFVPDQRQVAPETLTALSSFVQAGGTLLLTGGAMSEPAAAQALLGVKRVEPAAGALAKLTIGAEQYLMTNPWRLEPTTAKVVLKLADGQPALTSQPLGRGQVAVATATPRQYPDDGLGAELLRALGRGPSYRVDAGGDGAWLVTARRRPGQVVLHLCDLSARVNGVAADVDTAEYTDLNPPRNGVTVVMPLPAAPARIRAVPAGTLVTSSYANGLLRLTFNTLQTHAAAILDIEAERIAGALPADTARAGAAYHPADDRMGLLFSDDFDAVAAGQPPARPWAPEGRGAATVAIGEIGGRGAVVFNEAAGSSYFPFLHRSVTPFRRGTARLRYDLRFEPGCESLMELRYEGKGPGPALRIDGAGRLTASGQDLGLLPAGVWHHFEVEFALGGEQPGYSVTVTSPGAEPRSVRGLKHATDWFFRCDSVYFVGSGEKPGRFWVDNVSLERLTPR